MNLHLRRAVAALERGAAEIRAQSADSALEVRRRLHSTVEEVLTHLEADDAAADDPEDVVSRLDRQSRGIAEDLRRVEDLMRRRTGTDPDGR